MSVRYTYIPALSAIVAFSLIVSVTVIIGGCSEFSHVQGSTISRQNIEQAYRRLADEKQQLSVSQEDGKLYQNYFERWESAEKIDSAADLLERLAEMAKPLGVIIIPQQADNTANADSASSPAQVARRSMPSESTQPSNSDLILQTLMVRGSFDSVLSWMTQAEKEMGGLRITSVDWKAKSREEVELKADIQYRLIKGGTND